MAMEGSLLVTPEQLIRTSTEFSSTMGQVRSITTNMTETVKSLTTRWEGEASVAYQSKFNELQDDINKMATMIQEHVTDLNDMARRFQDAERASQDLASSLAGDVII